MRPVLSALVLLLALPLSAPSPAQDKSSAAKDLHALFDAEWERGLRENPIGATYIGDHRYRRPVAGPLPGRPEDLVRGRQGGHRRARQDRPAAADPRGPAEPGPVPPPVPGEYRHLRLRLAVHTALAAQRPGVDAPHGGRRRVQDGQGLRAVAESHRHARPARRPEHRLDARRREARPGAAEDHHAARAAAARQADRHGPDHEPVLRSVQEDARFDSGR